MRGCYTNPSYENRTEEDTLSAGVECILGCVIPDVDDGETHTTQFGTFDECNRLIYMPEVQKYC